MPNDVKAILSIVTVLVAIAYAWWEQAFGGRPDLFWFVIGFGVFSVAMMWIFPEAQKPKAPEKGGSSRA